MNEWAILQDALFLLLGAMLLGALFERFKQNAMLGYLLARTLLGAHALDALPNRDAILSVAELGVALLLFAIGMEFSWHKLRRIGSIALGGGTLQVLLTMGAAAWVGRELGLDMRRAIAIGATIALSSTALVTRLLFDRAEIDGLHGRSAVGILLPQDIAVVPLVLLVVRDVGPGDCAFPALGDLARRRNRRDLGIRPRAESRFLSRAARRSRGRMRQRRVAVCWPP